MFKSNTAIILILRDHLVPYRVSRETGMVQVLTTDCKSESLKASEPKPAWINVPDIVSALWVVGKHE